MHDCEDQHRDRDDPREYRTISDGEFLCAESSRTTVALDGSVWVGHRGPGRCNHVGLVELNQCVDRNGNGTIETSTGYGDVKAWPGTGSTPPMQRTSASCTTSTPTGRRYSLGDSRHMSIDANNKLWVGDYIGGSKFVRVDGDTGAVETAVAGLRLRRLRRPDRRNGIIWSARGHACLRWDPDDPDSATNPRCITGTTVYGIAIDTNGWIWTTVLSGGIVRKTSPDGNTILGPFLNGQPRAPRGSRWTQTGTSGSALALLRWRAARSAT